MLLLPRSRDSTAGPIAQELTLVLEPCEGQGARDASSTLKATLKPCPSPHKPWAVPTDSLVHGSWAEFWGHLHRCCVAPGGLRATLGTNTSIFCPEAGSSSFNAES